ncbi:hypothetical protein OF001_U50069 [Pseudomonas sp. OF001]|nr:hypothetical protein OF001_U50069 [Pseudomonas sp. OF001]
MRGGGDAAVQGHLGARHLPGQPAAADPARRHRRRQPHHPERRRHRRHARRLPAGPAAAADDLRPGAGIHPRLRRAERPYVCICRPPGPADIPITIKALKRNSRYPHDFQESRAASRLCLRSGKGLQTVRTDRRHRPAAQHVGAGLPVRYR